MPLQWVLEGVTEYVIEIVFELSVEIVGERFSRKLFGGKYEQLQRTGTRPRATVRQRLRGYEAEAVEQVAKIMEQPTIARGNCAEGKGGKKTVVLRALLGKDGKVKAVQPKRGAGNKATRLAIKAARELRFEPARKNGFAVAQWAEVSYEIEE